MTETTTETALDSRYMAALSCLVLSHGSPKRAEDWGLVATVLHEMEGAGLAERAGDRWIATPPGARAYRKGKKR